MIQFVMTFALGITLAYFIVRSGPCTGNKANSRAVLAAAMVTFARVKRHNLLALGMGVWKILLVQMASVARRPLYARVAACHLMSRWQQEVLHFICCEIICLAFTGFMRSLGVDLHLFLFEYALNCIHNSPSLGAPQEIAQLDSSLATPHRCAYFHPTDSISHSYSNIVPHLARPAQIYSHASQQDLHGSAE